ncbi:class I SAM-dependent methyltransferase, partial [Mycobacterium tuberculosis]
MTTSKSVRRLSAVPSTLRIPLAARASGDAMFPQMAVRDAYAASILEQIRDDGHALPEDRATIY